MLSAKGYATGAAIANSVIYGQGTNFEQGFDFYAGLHGEGDRPSKLVEAAGVVDSGLAWLEARRTGIRWLLQRFPGFRCAPSGLRHINSDPVIQRHNPAGVPAGAARPMHRGRTRTHRRRVSRRWVWKMSTLRATKVAPAPMASESGLKG